MLQKLAKQSNQLDAEKAGVVAFVKSYISIISIIIIA